MNNKKTLEIIKDRQQETKMIERLIKNEAFNHKESINILEAGCGRKWPFNLDGIQYTLTGVDTDKTALKIRKNTLCDLHEIIKGDLCTVDMASDKYDVIYCSYVLEHIKRADVVMNNFIKWVKPNGLIIIKVPNPYSVQGYITRITPHWFHVFYHRFVLGNKEAGKPGYGPYPTCYHPVISRKGISNYCNNNGVTLISEYGEEFVKPGKGIIKVLLCLFKKMINGISMGRLGDKNTNLLYIIRK